MSVSFYTCLTALLWFDLAVAACVILRRRGDLLPRFGMLPLVLALGAGLLRLVLPVEFASTKIINSSVVLPAVLELLRVDFPLWGGRTVSVGMLLPVCWAAGTCVRLAWVVLQLRQDRAAIRRCAAVPDARVEAAVARAVGAGARRYEVIVSPDVGAPIMAGFFKPVFVLPSYISAFSDTELRYIARHEWYHFHHHDIWVKLATEALICLLWWNPPVYLLRRDMDQFLEIRCDLALIREIGGGERTAYLETIVKSIRQENCGSAAPALSLKLAGTGNRSDIKQRFQMVARYERKPRSHAIWMFAAVLAVAWVASFFFVIQGYGLPSDEIMTEEGFFDEIGIIENSFFVSNEDGTYTLYFNGEPMRTPYSEEELSDPFWAQVPIMKGDTDK